MGDTVDHEDIHVSLTGKTKENSKSRRWRYINQALIVANASQWFMQLAMLAAWINPASYDFIKIGTNIYGDEIIFTETELDMLASLPNIGSILGAVYAWPVSWWGRKKTMMILVVPHILTWAIIGFSPTPGWILVGRVLSGFCLGATMLTVNTYMVEIPDVPIRGMIAMLSQLEIAAGYLLTVSLGLAFRYYHFSYLGIILSVIAAVLNYFVPESPAFLVTKNQEDEARQLLRKLRSPDDDIELELEMLKNENLGMEKNSFITVLKQPPIRKSMFIIVVILIFQQFSGIFICYMNTTRIFIDAGTNMNENLAVVFTFIFQFIGTVVGSITIEKIGRRHSLVISVIMVSIFLYIMGTHAYFYPNNSNETNIINSTISNEMDTTINNGVGNNWQWVPLVCLMGIVFSASLGLESVPWIISAEYFPTSIRAKAQSVCVTLVAFLSMVVFGFYSPMKSTLTIPGLYFFYATVSLACFVFSLIFVRETAGQNIG